MTECKLLLSISQKKKNKQICLPNKAYASDHIYQRTDMVAKCEIFVTITEQFIVHSHVCKHICIGIGINEKKNITNISSEQGIHI